LSQLKEKAHGPTAQWPVHGGAVCLLRLRHGALFEAVQVSVFG
jgi:hypothetical protein